MYLFSPNVVDTCTWKIILLKIHIISHIPAIHHLLGTPWKINMEPENDGLEDDFPFQLGDFYVPR